MEGGAHHQVFFKNKACRDSNCTRYPASLQGELDPTAQLWPVNFTYDAPQALPYDAL
jgi:hypothetical protein